MLATMRTSYRIDPGRLKAARKAAGLSVLDISIALREYASDVSRLESGGRSCIGLPKLLKRAVICGVRPAELLFEAIPADEAAFLDALAEQVRRRGA